MHLALKIADGERMDRISEVNAIKIILIMEREES